MSINKENYQAYLLDYVEGALSKKETDDLLTFLEENPELKSELDDFEESPLVADTSIHFDKATLLQTDLVNDSITADNVEDFRMADYDQLLSPEKSNALSKYTGADNSSDFSKLKLSADENIVYDDKERLIKTIPLYGNWVKYSAVAASLLLAFFVWQSKTNQPELVSQVQEHQDKTPAHVTQKSIVIKESISMGDEDEVVIKDDVVEEHISEVLTEKVITQQEIQFIIEKIEPLNNKGYYLSTNNPSRRTIKAVPVIDIPLEVQSPDLNMAKDSKKLKLTDILLLAFKKNVLKEKDPESNINWTDADKGIQLITRRKWNIKTSVSDDCLTRILTLKGKNFKYSKKIKADCN